MEIQRGIPEHIERTACLRNACHLLYLARGQISVAAGFDEACGRSFFDGNAAFDEDDPFISTVPMRGKYVAGRIAGEEFDFCIWRAGG